jgi:hypothetical protein
VTIRSGLPIPGLEADETYAIQVKSYEGKHEDLHAVRDLERAFQHYPEVTGGLILSTASHISDELEKSVTDLRERGGVGQLVEKQ